jgi:hypothetical protein
MITSVLSKSYQLDVKQFCKEKTNGELPTAPIMWSCISRCRIRMAIPRAAVVNVMFMNRKSWRVLNKRPRCKYAGLANGTYVLVKIKVRNLLLRICQMVAALSLSAVSSSSPKKYGLFSRPGPCAVTLPVQGVSHPGVILCAKVKEGVAGGGSDMLKSKFRLFSSSGRVSGPFSRREKDAPSRMVEVGSHDMDLSLNIIPFFSDFGELMDWG